MRFLLEGEWTGYHSAQAKIVHREVISDKKTIEWVKKNHSIRYSDGTLLILHFRQMKPHERLENPNYGYRELIRDCVRYDVNSVDVLAEKRKAKQPSAVRS